MATFRYAWQPFLLELDGKPSYMCSPEEAAQRNPEWVEEERERAHLWLCERTGQDFGYDSKKWRNWLEIHPDSTELMEAEKEQLHKRQPYLFVENRRRDG